MILKSKFYIGILYLLFAISCEQQPSGNVSSNPAPTSQTPAVINSKLYLLYTRVDPSNSSNTPLDVLCNSEEIDELGKIVFQFYFDTRGNLTLAAFAGEKHHLQFDDDFSPIMDTLIVPGMVASDYPDIPSNTALGDLEISVRRNGLKKLKKIWDKSSTYKFIIFVAKTLTDSDMSGRQFLTYILVPQTDLPKNKTDYDALIKLANTTDKDKLIQSGSVQTNPSPPRGGY